MFGATISTCDDSSRQHCDRNAAVGKMSFWGKVSAEYPEYEKTGSKSP
jgi:hypothetical protein